MGMLLWLNSAPALMSMIMFISYLLAPNPPGPAPPQLGDWI
jgi:hypothetical protein